MSPRLGLLADVVRFSWVDGPGNRFVVFLQGCNLDCLACHNPHTIPTSSTVARTVTVEELLDEIRPVAPFLSGITVSGGEATLQPDFVRALFEAVKSDPGLATLTTFVDSNGAAPLSTWNRLMPVMDAAMLDLKALDPALHRRLTGRGNGRVLASIRHLARAGRLHEVRLLLIPGHNDAPDELRRTADWLLSVDPAVRVKVIGFRAHGVRSPARHWAEPTPEQLSSYGEILAAAGLREPVLV